MSTQETEFARLKKRVATLEAAHGLRPLLPPDEDQQALAEACSQAGIGVRAVQGNGRSEDTVLRRRAVARVLRRSGWTVPRIARAINKATGSVWKML